MTKGNYPHRLSFAVLLLLFFVPLVYTGYESPPKADNEDNPTPISTQPNSVITIEAVGDIMMGSIYPVPILPPDDGNRLFESVADELINSDIAIGNLESPFCDSEIPPKKIINEHNYIFATTTNYAKNLVRAGFDVLNLANNHIGDFGEIGIKTTKLVLDRSGIKYTGFVGDIADLTIRDKRVSVVGFSTSPLTNNLLNIRKAQRIIADLKRQSAIVIVTFHGGSEGIKSLHTKDTFEYYLDEPRGNVVKFAHSVIDSGADLVLGHGPHIPRALEIYKNKLIAYSLGNFCTYGQFCLKRENGLSLILKVNLDTSGNFLTGKIIPLYQEVPGIPKPDSTGRSIKLIKDLSYYDFPLSAPNIESNGILTHSKRETYSSD